METMTSAKLHTCLSIFTFLCCISGDLAQLQLPQTNVEVIQGKRVVLQASYTGPEIQKSTVIWNYVSSSTEMIISYVGGVFSYSNSRFAGRVGFIHNMTNNNLSLYINNARASDSGKYMCQVIIPAGPADTKEIILNVKVPPSVPVCQVKGKPVLKGNITLACNSKDGKPTPGYKWTKTSPSSEIFFPPAQNETAGTLKLNNLSSNISGKYMCTASNSAGTETCYINLEVVTSTNAGMIAGVTVGCILALILIILFFVFMWTRRKDTEEDLANDINFFVYYREDAQAPKRISWAKSGTGSDIISKNGTLSSIHTGSYPRDTQNHHHYPHSDTASILTATGGSISGYRSQPPADATLERTLPGYNTNPTLPRGPSRPPSTSGGSQHSSMPRPASAQPQIPRPPMLPTTVTTANISRMGGVPIMVPAQNQAGSLV
ncbi:endothelial cell-selective adhesion molecule-like isoform X1 [Carassius auratus]|uniref:Endothelial cell-selective adhesion molecule-like isoform X1 n=1 Tax=Carassius auratus TaxID=7957 RepID=A0A6P6KWD1_CARAU|nr:endothelial cell-selective adhesion molecule-like isoform X1 [Carassius auratus]